LCAISPVPETNIFATYKRHQTTSQSQKWINFLPESRNSHSKITLKTFHTYLLLRCRELFTNILWRHFQAVCWHIIKVWPQAIWFSRGMVMLLQYFTTLFYVCWYFCMEIAVLKPRFDISYYITVLTLYILCVVSISFTMSSDPTQPANVCHVIFTDVIRSLGRGRPSYLMRSTNNRACFVVTCEIDLIGCAPSLCLLWHFVIAAHGLSVHCIGCVI